MPRPRTVPALVVGLVIGLLLAGTPALAAGGDLAAKALKIAKKADKRSKEALAKTAQPGPVGPAGPAGATGPAGPAVLPVLYNARSGSSISLTASYKNLVAVSPPPGVYLVSASSGVAGSGRVYCQVVSGTVELPGRGGVADASVAVNGAITVSGTTPVQLQCRITSGAPTAEAPALDLVPVSRVVDSSPVE